MAHPHFFTNLKKVTQTELANKNVVLVGGCFDVLHLGHIEFLQFAKKQGDVLIVALESDGFIKKHKKRTPVHSALERKKILEAVRSVDYVILLPLFSSYDEYFSLVTTIKPFCIVCTEGDPQLKNKTRQAESVGARVAVCPHINGFSTSHIVSGRMVASHEV